MSKLASISSISFVNSSSLVLTMSISPAKISCKISKSISVHQSPTIIYCYYTPAFPTTIDDGEGACDTADFKI